MRPRSEMLAGSPGLGRGIVGLALHIAQVIRATVPKLDLVERSQVVPLGQSATTALQPAKKPVAWSVRNRRLHPALGIPRAPRFSRETRAMVTTGVTRNTRNAGRCDAQHRETLMSSK
jgi:hypothetical protein